MSKRDSKLKLSSMRRISDSFACNISVKHALSTPLIAYKRHWTQLREQGSTKSFSDSTLIKHLTSQGVRTQVAKMPGSTNERLVRRIMFVTYAWLSGRRNGSWRFETRSVGYRKTVSLFITWVASVKSALLNSAQVAICWYRRMEDALSWHARNVAVSSVGIVSNLRAIINTLTNSNAQPS